MSNYSIKSQWIKPEEAEHYRVGLFDLGLYPPNNLEGDPGWSHYLQNIKQDLPEIIQTLKPNDLVTIYRLAIAMANHPPSEDLHANLGDLAASQGELAAKIELVKSGQQIVDCS